jgi:hypothetical protein
MSRQKYEKIVHKIVKNAPLNGVLNPLFVKALIGTESNWDPSFEDGAKVGLMAVSKLGLVEANARWGLNLQWSDMKDIEKNILAGACYFAYLLGYWKTKTPYNPFYPIFAVLSYHFGVGNVTEWLYHAKENNQSVFKYLPDDTITVAFNYMWWVTYYINRGGA